MGQGLCVDCHSLPNVRKKNQHHLVGLPSLMVFERILWSPIGATLIFFFFYCTEFYEARHTIIFQLNLPNLVNILY